jgi:hypothetical protein
MLCSPYVINDLQVAKFIAKKNLKPGVDYKFVDLDKTKIEIPRWSKTLGSGAYQYILTTPTSKYPYIGRYYDSPKGKGESKDSPKQIIDVIFSLPTNTGKFNDSNPPFTLGWDYNLKHSSVSTVTMGIVNRITDLKKRRNPLYVATFIAANLDSNNSEFGIMEGNWTISDFKPDQCPSNWKDSSMICRKYLEQGRAPVKYAQCWVFADLLTGMLRFLGIIARTVKIHNCHIDIHNVSGIDLFDPEVKFKSSYHPGITDNGTLSSATNSDITEVQTSSIDLNMINITRHLLFSGDLKYVVPDSELPELKTVKPKGYLFKKSKYMPITTDEDLICLNYLTKEGRNWNFHVWTEVYFNKRWWILDPSPVSDYKYYDTDVSTSCGYDACSHPIDNEVKDHPTLASPMPSDTVLSPMASAFMGRDITLAPRPTRLLRPVVSTSGPLPIKSVLKSPLISPTTSDPSPTPDTTRRVTFDESKPVLNPSQTNINSTDIFLKPTSSTDAITAGFLMTTSLSGHEYCYDEFKGKKFFGPTAVDSIRNNNGIGNSFRYLQTAVNGPLRYWNVIFVNDNIGSKDVPGSTLSLDVLSSGALTAMPQPVFYLKNVVYNTSKVVGKDKRGQTIDRTPDYRRKDSDNPDDYYCLHRYNPVYLYFDGVAKSFKDLKFKYRASLIGSQLEKGYLVQTCLFFNSVLLMCHRYKTQSLSTIVRQNLAVDDDPRANKLTIVIYCLTTQKWWSQMIRL